MPLDIRMNNIDHSFQSIHDAVQALLLDVTGFINSTGRKYLVIGGWSPYLLNTTAHAHPGTKDVDILFSDGNVRETLKEVIRGLLSRGYKVSAKHDFQLLRAIDIQGHQLVFNVDLLHPSESVNNPEMMVDHFDLGIKDSDFSDGKKIKSIVLPSSELLFLDGFSEPYTLTANNLQGAEASVCFPLLGHAGLILSKAESVSAPKRPRDSFDIFLATKSGTAHQTIELLKKYKHLAGVQALLTSLESFAKRPSSTPDQSLNQFDLNVYRFLKMQEESSPSAAVLALLADV